MHDNQQVPERRNFFVRCAAAVIGVVVGIVPLAAGLVTIFDPLRRSAPAAGFIKLVRLDALPKDGTPIAVPVISDRVDAWNRYPNEPIGRVFLRRMPDRGGEPVVIAFNAVCPHAGCFVAHEAGSDMFQCPCHRSAFTLDGEMRQPSPSPRDMDVLECKFSEEKGEKTVWVKFQNFYTGISQPKAKA